MVIYEITQMSRLVKFSRLLKLFNAMWQQNYVAREKSSLTFNVYIVFYFPKAQLTYCQMHEQKSAVWWPICR